jgi:uncharacterized protein HemY
MTKAISQSSTKALETAIQLARSAKTQQEAHAAFDELCDSIQAENPQTAAMLQLLWREYVRTQRSAEFWQELCQVEKHLSERISESHVQLKQNYQRLMQEQ